MGLLSRTFDVVSVTLTNALASTEAIPFGRFAGGSFEIPAGYNSTSLTVYGASSSGTDPYLPLYDESGNAITITIAASRVVNLPTQVYGCAHLKFVTNNALDNSTAVNLIRKG